MSLKILTIEEEEPLEISNVPLSSEVDHADEADMELPGEFLVQDDLDLLQDSACALESIGSRIAIEGIDISTARELDKHVPGFIKRAGGSRVFTPRPSLEGLSDAATSVKETLVSIVRRVREFVASMYKKMLAWFQAKFSKAEVATVKQTVQEFLNERRNKDAMAYMTNLPEDAQEAADEVARWVDGDSKAFASALANQLPGIMKITESIEHAIDENPTHFRLVQGIVSVQELFKEDQQSAINTMLKKASQVADNSMKTRDSSQFMAAIEAIGAVTQELDEFEKGMVVNDQATDQEGQHMSMDKMYDNVVRASNDFMRVDVQSQVKSMTGAVESIIQISEGTALEEILEMIPEDVPEANRNGFAQKIAALYRKIAALGKDILKLWNMRAQAVQSINTIGDKLIALVDAFEKGVVQAGSALADEQKEQLVKAMAGKGFTIEF